MKPRILFVMMSLGLMAGIANQTFAQEATDINSLSLEDLLNVKVTTASKISQRAGEAPASVIVITAKQIKARGYRNLAEILNDLTDVKVNDKSDPQSYNQIIIRGIARQDRFVILMDGVKISSPTNESMPLLENFPIYLARQIEVVFGPGSALYGADAMSGVINIITDKGEGSEQLNVTTMAGSEGYTNQNLFVRKTLKGGMNLTVAGQFTYDKQPDFSKIYTKEFPMASHQSRTFNSAYGPMEANQPIDANYSAPVKNYNLYMSLDKGGFDFKLLRHYTQVPSSTTLLPDNGVYNKNVFYGQGITTANVSYTDSIGAVKSVTSIQGSVYEVNPKSNFRNLYGGMEHGYKYAYGSMTKLDEQLSFNIAKNITAMGGVTYEVFTSLPKSAELAEPLNRKTGATKGILLNSQDVNNPKGIAAKFYQLRYNNIGSFFQTQLTPMQQVAITLGVRYDHNSRFGSTVNPRVGLVYHYSPKTTIKALYGTAYWAPSPHVSFEQYGSFYSLDSGRTYRSDFLHLPNPELKPTTLKTSELSISQKINKVLNVTVTGYYTQMRNLIFGGPDDGNTNLYNNTYLGFPVAYIEVPINTGTQKNYGANIYVNGVFKIGDTRLNTWSSLSWVEGHIYTNKSSKVDIPLIAPFQFRAGIEGNTGDFSYSLIMLRSGKQRMGGFENPNEPYRKQAIPGYTLVNASAGYNFKNNFTFFTKIQNVLNQRYRNSLDIDINEASPATFAGSLQDPLRIVAGVTFNLH